MQMINCNNPILNLDLDEEKLKKDFIYFKTKRIDKFPKTCKSNYIIRYFQQDTFFKEEKELWKSSRDLRDQLIINRCMYLNKNQNELTAADMFASFKISGVHYGYSHFNPFWFKWFINEHNIKTCYDPCGGWGHRLLGSQDLDLYIYNDLSKTTKANVDKMIDYFNIKNCKTYCNDATKFMPEENFEAMFTCPPYFNLEHYECGDFKDINEFKSFVDKLFDVFNNKETCKTFGIVIREDMLFKHQNHAKKIPLNKVKTHLIKEKKVDECLFIFNKVDVVRSK